MTRTARESELLAVTLQLLQERGYDGLTVDEVAATARASKATMYRRWPTKAELVLAAVMEGVNQLDKAPDTGDLRTDRVTDWQTIGPEPNEPNEPTDLRHFLFYLRDETFECSARDWRLENPQDGTCPPPLGTP